VVNYDGQKVIAKLVSIKNNINMFV